MPTASLRQLYDRLNQRLKLGLGSSAGNSELLLELLVLSRQ
jgi:hypothetical protein